MKVIFKFASVRQEQALPMLLGCLLLPMFVVWLIGQLFPLLEGPSLLLCIVAVGGGFFAGYWLIKRFALENVLVELSPEALVTTYSTGQAKCVSLNSIVRHSYFVTRGAHILLVQTTTGQLKLTTTALFESNDSVRQFEAMVQLLKQLLNPVT